MRLVSLKPQLLPQPSLLPLLCFKMGPLKRSCLSSPSRTLVVMNNCKTLFALNSLNIKRPAWLPNIRAEEGCGMN